MRLADEAVEGDFISFGLAKPEIELTSAFYTPYVPVLSSGLLLVDNIVAFLLDPFVFLFYRIDNGIHLGRNLLQVILCISSPVLKLFALKVPCDIFVEKSNKPVFGKKLFLRLWH